jgi:hypothetical protein
MRVRVVKGTTAGRAMGAERSLGNTERISKGKGKRPTASRCAGSSAGGHIRHSRAISAFASASRHSSALGAVAARAEWSAAIWRSAHCSREAALLRDGEGPGLDPPSGDAGIALHAGTLVYSARSRAAAPEGARRKESGCAGLRACLRAHAKPARPPSRRACMRHQLRAAGTNPSTSEVLHSRRCAVSGTASGAANGVCVSLAPAARPPASAMPALPITSHDGRSRERAFARAASDVRAGLLAISGADVVSPGADVVSPGADVDGCRCDAERGAAGLLREVAVGGGDRGVARSGPSRAEQRRDA